MRTRTKLIALASYIVAMGYFAPPVHAYQEQYCDAYILGPDGHEYKFAGCNADGTGYYSMCDPYEGGEWDNICDGYYANPTTDSINVWDAGHYEASCVCSL